MAVPPRPVSLLPFLKLVDPDGLIERLVVAIEDARRNGSPVAGRDPEAVAKLANTALRRWNSFSRRSREAAPSDAARVEDLAKGLRDTYEKRREQVGPLMDDYRHLAAVLANQLRAPGTRSPR